MSSLFENLLCAFDALLRRRLSARFRCVCVRDERERGTREGRKVSRSERERERREKEEREREREKRATVAASLLLSSAVSVGKSLARPRRGSQAQRKPPPRQSRTPFRLTIGHPFLAIEHQEPARLRQRSGRRLSRNWRTANSLVVVVFAPRMRLSLLSIAHRPGRIRRFRLASEANFKAPSPDASVRSTRSRIAALIARSFRLEKTVTGRKKK